MTLSWFWRALTRRKVVDTRPTTASTSEDPQQSFSSPLARVLTTVDLTALGVGSTLGVGVYVLAGSVARDFAGPAVILSFLVAAIASVFAGLCYAEFGARVPLAGSAYIYSYVSIGEFMAFVIGWNLIMEYVIGCASVARGLSNYLDQLMDNVMQDTFQSMFHLHVAWLSPYVDFFAFSISFLLSVVLAFGVKESMSLNNVFTAVNMAVVLFVIVAGSFKADIANWQIDSATIPPNFQGGKGGFFPFGVMGVLRGAATCFYGFIGFDCVATTGEEVQNPQRAIPIAIIVSLVIIFLSYFGVSAVLTLMWPYYLQDPDAPLPFVFHEIGWPAAQWAVAIGGIFGLFASLFGAMYPLPRVIYAMANDGLIFKFLGEVHPKYKTPLVGTLLAGVITGVMAALFKLQQLVNMLSIGTLVAYTMVAACVVLLRYKYEVYEPTDMQNEEEAVSLLSDSERLTSDIYRPHESDETGVTEYKETTNLVSLQDKPTISKVFAQFFNARGLKHPTAVTSRLVAVLVVVFCGLSIGLGLCLVHWENELMYGHWGPLASVCVLSSLLLLVVLSISLQPSSSTQLAFKVPFVPVIPALSILLNIYLILMLDVYTWIRFMVWMACGLVLLTCRQCSLCGSRAIAPSERLSSTLQTSAPPLSTTTLLGTPLDSMNMNGTLNDQVKMGSDQEMCQTETSQISEAMGFALNSDADIGLRIEEQNAEINGVSGDSDLPDEVLIEANIQCDRSSDNIIVRSVDFAEINTTRLASAVVPSKEDLNDGMSTTNHTSFDGDCERFNLVESGRENPDEVACWDSDDNTSITDVTNELLSMYENEILHEKCLSVNAINNALVNDQKISNRAIEFNSGSSNPIEPKNTTDNVSDKILVDHISTSFHEDDIEDDVRSLYPNVVVISSSEEELQSRRSSISSSHVCVEIGQDFINPNEVIFPHIHSNISDKTTSSMYINAKSNEPVNCEENGNGTVNYESKAVSFSLSPFQPPESALDVKSGSESDRELEVLSHLKNTSFVKKLEEIIGSQSLCHKLSFHKPLRRKSKSMDRIDISSTEDVPNNFDKKEVLFSSVSSGKSSIHSEPVTSADGANLGPSILKETNKCDSDREDETSTPDNDETNDGEDITSFAGGDIRAKLERIFSREMNSAEISPISKMSRTALPASTGHSNDSEKQFPAKELNELNLTKPSVGLFKEARSSSDIALDEEKLSKERDETRQRMVNVLGTLRLKNLETNK